MKHLLFFLFLTSGLCAQECLPITWFKITANDCGDGGIFDVIEDDTTKITISDIEGLNCAPCASSAQALCGDVLSNNVISTPILLYLYDYVDLSYKIYSEGDLECNNANNDDRIALSYVIGDQTETIISVCGNNSVKTGTVRIDGTSCDVLRILVAGGTSSKSEFWHVELSIKVPEAKADPKPIINDIGTEARYVCQGDKYLFFSEIEDCDNCTIEWTNYKGEVIGDDLDIWYTFVDNDDKTFRLTVTSSSGCTTYEDLELDRLSEIDFFGDKLATVCTTVGFVQNYSLPLSIFDMYLLWEGDYVVNNRFNLDDAPAGTYTLTYKNITGNCEMEGTTTIEILPADNLGVQDTISLCTREGSYELPELVDRNVDGYWLEVGSNTLAIIGNIIFPDSTEPGTYRLKFIPNRTNAEYNCVDATLIIVIQGPEDNVECSSTLPIQWVSFTGESVDGHNMLIWKLTDDTADRNFTVLHSRDGDSYSPLPDGAVDYRSDRKSFSFLHAYPGGGLHFYKIMMHDELGNISYSNIITIDNDAQESTDIAIYPNPVSSTLQITSPDTVTGYRVYNVAGRVVLSELAIDDKKSVDVKSLPQGIYYIRIIFNVHEEEFKFVKL